MDETLTEHEAEPNLVERLARAIEAPPGHSTHAMIRSLHPSDAGPILQELQQSDLDTAAFVERLEELYDASIPAGQMNKPWYNYLQPIIHLVATGQYLDALHGGMTIEEFSDTAQGDWEQAAFGPRFGFQANNLISILLEIEAGTPLSDTIVILAKQTQELRLRYAESVLMAERWNVTGYFPAETLEESQHAARAYQRSTGIAYLTRRLDLERRYLRYLFAQDEAAV